MVKIFEKNKKTICRTICLCVAVIMACIVLSGCEKNDEYVVKIDGEIITQNQFAFFCSLVLEDEAFTYSAYYDTDENFTESVKAEALAFAKEYVARYHEAEKNGFTMSQEDRDALAEEAEEDYKEYNEEYGVNFTEEEYYDFFYGITKEEYLLFKERWQIIDEYNDYQYSVADTSIESQQKAYEKYESFLNARTTAVIVIDTEDKTTEETENAKSFAQLILNRAKNGEDFNELMVKYSDDTDLTKDGGEVDISASFQTLYPNLYKWSQSCQVGDLAMVTESTGYYIVKCVKIITFEDLKDTDTMIEWTQFAETQEQISEVLNNPKYEGTVNKEQYDSCDIQQLISDAIEYWTALWDAYGFPATS